MNKRCIIMRGAPGSGKTTWLRTHYPQAIVCSADLWRTAPDGTYIFNAHENKQAHNACFALFEAATATEFPVVAVDNTNIKLWEFEKYIRCARDRGYEVLVQYLPGAPYANIHGVPPEVVERMCQTYEPYNEGEQI